MHKFVNAKVARAIAGKMRNHTSRGMRDVAAAPDEYWRDVRDYVDLRSCGEMDAFSLDRLTQMVINALQREVQS